MLPDPTASSVEYVDRAAESQTSNQLSPEKADPLLEHLKAKYKQQRHKQIAEMKRKVENDHTESMEKNIHELLHPSLELLSDFAILLMNELETLCLKNNLERGVELVKQIRVLTNNEIRQAVSAIENGYTSGFQTLQRQAAYKLDILAPAKCGGGSTSSSGTGGGGLLPTGRSTSSGVVSVTGTRRDRGSGRQGGGIGEDGWPTPPSIRGMGGHPRDSGGGTARHSRPPHSSHLYRSSSSSSSSSHQESREGGNGIRSDLQKKDALRACPKQWKTNLKEMVVEELFYQQGITCAPKNVRQGLRTSPKEKLFSLKECCSAVPSFFAESLASLLVCEVVRIYLYDENHNLHCCCTYPYHAFQADPMHGTYKEIMLAKDFHSMVCSQLMAVNGYESKRRSLRKDEQLPQVKKDLEGSGWSSIRSCLMFPIIPLLGANKNALGMIHCANKVAVSSKEPAAFTNNDEVLCSMASRLLGCMLSRYPVANFSLRVGEVLRKATFPFEPTTAIDDHLQDRLHDVVEDAAEAGHRAMVAPVPIMILRAPLNEIDPSKEKRARARKMGTTLAMHDSTLSSVEFNIRSVNELWQTGMEENIIMHQQYRKLEESMRRTKLLLQNILDGLAAARSMHRAEDITMYLQTLELFGRSESVEMLSEFIAETLIGGRMKPKGERKLLFPDLPTLPPASLIGVDSVLIRVDDGPPPPRAQSSATSASKPTSSFRGILKLSPAATAGSTGVAATELAKGGLASQAGKEEFVEGAFLSPSEVEALQHRHQLVNAPIASKIHADGPDSIRCYSCDPVKKREQMLFIDRMMEEGIRRNKEQEEEKSGIRKGIPAYLQNTKAMAAKKVSLAHPGILRHVSRVRKNVSFNKTERAKKDHPFLIQ